MKRKGNLFVWLLITVLSSLVFSGQAWAVTVSNVAELCSAISTANSGGDTDIKLEDGTYTLDNSLWVEAEGVTVSSVSGNRSAVIIEGAGMNGSVSHIFGVAGSNFTVQNVTLRKVANHAVQIHGEMNVNSPVIRNVHIQDTYEQMIKVSYDSSQPINGSQNGLVEKCLFEYTAGIGPQYYIGGIDAHNTTNWIIRDNEFRDIRSPSEDLAEHAIHFWSNSQNTLVERNLVINCDRGIGFGLGDRGHIGGTIRNNMIYHDTSEGFADVAISLESTTNAQVYNNTIYMEHSYSNAIEYRFAATTGLTIINNLTNKAITARDGASAAASNNITNAIASWFVNPSAGDLHLSYAVPSVVDQGQGIEGLTDDFDKNKRPQGIGYDIGADEYPSENIDATADIKVNDVDGPITVSSGATISISVSFDPGSHSEENADWWVAELTPSGSFNYYDLSTGSMVPGFSPTHQGPLFSLGTTQLLSSSDLTVGTHTFYFAVDMNMNGLLDYDQLYFDAVVVNITQ